MLAILLLFSSLQVHNKNIHSLSALLNKNIQSQQYDD